MRQRLALLAVFFSLFAVISVAAKGHSRLRARAPLPPSRDPFYQPPSGWQQKSNGDILRSRKIQAGSLQFAKYDIDAYELLYRTTAISSDEPSFTVTTILKPSNAHNKMFLFGVFEDAGFMNCAPSYIAQAGAPLDKNLALEVLNLQWTAAANEGWTVVIPDNEGPNSIFDGPLAGRQSLDAARAAINYEPSKLSKNAKIVGYGYSGGALSIAWAASLQKSYASDLNVIGWVLGGTPANLADSVRNIDQGPFTGIATGVLNGIFNGFPDVKNAIIPHLTAKGKEFADFGTKHCLVSNVLAFPFFHLLSDQFIKGGAKLLQQPDLRKVLLRQNLGQKAEETPIAPVTLLHTKADEFALYNDTRVAARNWARFGSDVHLVSYTDPVVEHIGLALLDLPQLILSARRYFDGQKIPKGFTEESHFNPDTSLPELTGGLAEIYNVLKSLFGQRVGSNAFILKQRIRSHSKNA